MQPLLGEKIDLSEIRFQNSNDMVREGYKGWTFKNTIVVSDFFMRQTNLVQFLDAIHEITHSVQYRELGMLGFLGRAYDESKLPGDPKYGEGA
jgi:hypothetical protein